MLYTLFSFQVDGVGLEPVFFFFVLVCLFLCFLGRGGGCLFPMVELPPFIMERKFSSPFKWMLLSFPWLWEGGKRHTEKENSFWRERSFSGAAFPEPAGKVVTRTPSVRPTGAPGAVRGAEPKPGMEEALSCKES